MEPVRKPPPVPEAYLSLVRREVADRRAAAGLSPEALARAAGVSPAAVRKIESGENAPSLGTLYALAAALGCEVRDLLPAPRRKS